MHVEVNTIAFLGRRWNRENRGMSTSFEGKVGDARRPIISMDFSVYHGRESENGLPES